MYKKQKYNKEWKKATSNESKNKDKMTINTKGEKKNCNVRILIVQYPPTFLLCMKNSIKKY